MTRNAALLAAIIAPLALALPGGPAAAQLASDAVTYRWSSVEFFPAQNGCRVGVSGAFVQGGIVYGSIRNQDASSTYRVRVSAGIHSASGQTVGASWLGVLGPQDARNMQLVAPPPGSLVGSKVVVRIQECERR